MTYRLRNILLAVVLAVLAAFLTALYVANYQNRVDAGQEKVKVLVAKIDIAPGTAAGNLSGKISEKEILRKNVVPVAVSDLESIEGQASSQWIYSGEQLSARRFSVTGRSGIHGELKGNLRAIQISGTQHQLLAGILRAGDHIDIVANLSLKDDARAARTVLRDLRVLRASTASSVSSGLSDGGRGGGHAVVLQVTDSQAHKLFFITSNEDHSWSLQLRPVTDATDSPESISTLPSVLRDGLPRNQSGR
jgi:Flp pilus assembly protein CpaB